MSSKYSEVLLEAYKMAYNHRSRINTSGSLISRIEGHDLERIEQDAAEVFKSIIRLRESKGLRWES